MNEYPNALSQLVITRILRILTVRMGRNDWSCQDRDCWGLVFRRSGHATFVCNGRETPSNTENVIILPRGSSYSFSVDTPGTYIFVEFEADLDGDEIFSLPLGSNTDRVLKTLHAMEYHGTVGYPYHALEQIHGVYDILLSLLIENRLLYVQKDKAVMIEKIAEYISGHYAKELSNAYLAGRCGISEVYFRKLFSEVMGVSPITYLHKVRAAKAAELLQGGAHSVSEIASLVGYSNVYHFSAMFKKYQGIPPSKYALLFKEL